MSKVQNNKSSVRYHIVAKKNIKNPDIIYSSRTVKIAHNFEKGTNEVFVTIQKKKNNGYLWQYCNLRMFVLTREKYEHLCLKVVKI